MSWRRRKFRAAGLFLVGLLTAGATPPRGSPEDLFARGNEAYARGDYEEAAASYQEIVRSGIRNSLVYYNLGNSRFKANRIGPAILFYEKALKLDPTDTDARENLRYANLRIRDRISEEEDPFLLGLFGRARDSLALDRVTGLFLGFYLATMALAAVWILAGSARSGAAAGVGALILAGITTLAGGWMSLQAEERASSDRAIVLAEKSEVLSGPGSENTLLASVHEGTKVRIHNRREDWVQVVLPDGRAGWMKGETLGVI